MEQHHKSTSVVPSTGVFVGSSHLGSVALLVFLTMEMLMSQLFFAGEWWGIKSVALSLLLAMVPSALMTILFLVAVNWMVDRREADRRLRQGRVERAAPSFAGGHIFTFDEGSPDSRDTARFPD
jgi:hypothetical protein